jgi:hypothetical protein
VHFVFCRLQQDGAYAQGMALIAAADRQYGYGIHLDEIARIWNGGYIIREAFLDEIEKTFREEPDSDDGSSELDGHMLPVALRWSQSQSSSSPQSSSPPGLLLAGARTRGLRAARPSHRAAGPSRSSRRWGTAQSSPVRHQPRHVDAHAIHLVGRPSPACPPAGGRLRLALLGTPPAAERLAGLPPREARSAAAACSAAWISGRRNKTIRLRGPPV